MKDYKDMTRKELEQEFKNLEKNNGRPYLMRLVYDEIVDRDFKDREGLTEAQYVYKTRRY